MRRVYTLLLFLILTPIGLFAKATKVVRVRASYYANKFEGRLTSSGAVFHNYLYTAASLQFPLGSRLLVTNAVSGRSIVVEVNDRGPWVKKFQLDLSEAAARAIGITRKNGWAVVTVKRIK